VGILESANGGRWFISDANHKSMLIVSGQVIRRSLDAVISFLSVDRQVSSSKLPTSSQFSVNACTGFEAAFNAYLGF
jgi:hypothetical protein